MKEIGGYSEGLWFDWLWKVRVTGEGLTFYWLRPNASN